MSDCDRFEREYGRLTRGELEQRESDALREHSRLCPNCATFTPESDSLRSLLMGQPAYRPSIAFERQLDTAIQGKQPVFKTSRQVGSLQGWASIGAGMATGLAIGFFMLLAPQSVDNRTVASAPVMVAANRSSVSDSAASHRDSLKQEERPYQLDENSRTVSEH